MADQTFTYDAQEDWESGDELNDVIAYDPAGKLIPSIGITTIAGVQDDYSLAVYCRVRDGSGTTIANLGSANDGTLANLDGEGTSDYSWSTKTDGRAELTGGKIAVSHHSSFDPEDSAGHEWTQGAGIRFKLSSVSAQELMARAGRFVLGIDADDKPYVQWVHSGGIYTLTAGAAYVVEANVPTVLEMYGSGGSCELYKDGKRIASVSGLSGKDCSTGDLVVKCTGTYSDFYLLGNASGRGYNIPGNRSSGTWEKTVDLGETADQTLRYIEVEASKGTRNSITIYTSFGDDIGHLEEESTYTFSIEEWSTQKFYPPETGLSHGRYLLIRISMSGQDFDYQLPVLDKLTVVTRDISTVAYDEEDFDDDTYEEVFVLEAKKPESLEEALADIKKLKEIVRNINEELGRTTRASWGVGTSMRHVTNHYSGLAADQVERISDIEGDISRLETMISAVHAMLLGHTTNTSVHIDCGASTNACRDWVTNQLSGYVTYEDISYYYSSGEVDAEIEKAIDAHNGPYEHGCPGAGIACDIGYATPEDVTTAIGTHAALTTGVHGAESKYLVYDNNSGQILTSRIASHAGATATHGCTGGEIACISDIPSLSGYATESWVGDHYAAKAYESTIDTHIGQSNPHSGSASNTALGLVASDLSSHAGAANPHSGSASTGDITSAINAHDDSSAHNCSVIQCTL